MKTEPKVELEIVVNKFYVCGNLASGKMPLNYKNNIISCKCWMQFTTRNVVYLIVIIADLIDLIVIKFYVYISGNSGNLGILSNLNQLSLSKKNLSITKSRLTDNRTYKINKCANMKTEQIQQMQLSFT